MNTKKQEVLKDIWLIADGQASKSKIGSRAVPHHLRPHEKPIFEKAIQRGYMILKPNARPNLENLFYLYNQQLDQPTYIYRQSEEFPTQEALIQQKLKGIKPQSYAKTRNHLQGDVTKLSPYITHGILPLREVWDFTRKNYTDNTSRSENKLRKDNHFYKELAWREYFQQVYNSKGNSITQPPGLKNPQSRNDHHHLPEAIVQAKTGIKTIDQSIRGLYSEGYMHNHARMWTASITCNLARTSWKPAADWLFYHLIDGDIASNYLSWQWVAGSFSNKLYWANQDNINKYSPKQNHQSQTFLDHSYEDLPELEVPTELQQRVEDLQLITDLSPIQSDKVEDTQTLLYSIWYLDPYFRHQLQPDQKQLQPEFQNHQKALLLEPSFFDRFPMSPNRISFILGLAQNIPGLKIVVQDFDQFTKQVSKKNLNFIRHTSLPHWENTDSNILNPPYLFPELNQYYPSFFKYWNKVMKTAKFKTT